MTTPGLSSLSLRLGGVIRYPTFAQVVQVFLSILKWPVPHPESPRKVGGVETNILLFFLGVGVTPVERLVRNYSSISWHHELVCDVYVVCGWDCCIVVVPVHEISGKCAYRFKKSGVPRPVTCRAEN